MSFRRSLRRWQYRRSSGSLALPAHAPRRGDEPIGPVTSITPPSPTRSSSERTGTHVGIRLSVTVFVVISLFCVLLARLWSLQLVQGAALNSAARSETQESVEVAPPRGEIVTRDGMVLAGDTSEWKVDVQQDEATTHPEVITRLADLLGISRKDILTALKSNQYASFAPIPLPTTASQVTNNDVLYIQQNSTEFPGVTVTEGSARDYPQGSLATQVLGYVRGNTPQNIIGQSGLEAQYQNYLRGKPGVDTFEVDASGIPVSEISSSSPVPGDSLVLNMDGGLQSELSSALAQQLVSLRDSSGGAPWGGAVVLNANTGAVLAMVSEPTYNDNVWNQPVLTNAEYAALSPAGCNTGAPGVGCPQANYATQGLQPPGSTFKLATATAALNDGLITPYTTIDDTGSFTVGTQTLHDSDNEALGPVNVTSALSESSDVFFYTMGLDFWLDQKQYGVTPIQNVAEQYGLGVPSGIDLPNASVGQIDSPSLRIALHAESPNGFPNTTYFPGDNVQMAFGQGETLVTPLELAGAYATFANGGTRYAPEMAAAVVNPSGKVLKQFAPKVMSHVDLPSSTREPMLEGFQNAVQTSSGTAYAAFSGFNLSKWNVAGKTGTATVCLNDTCPPTSWFVAFGGPRTENPQYVVAVEIDEGGFGAEASAPVARDVFNYLYSHPVGAVSIPGGH